MMSTLSSVHMLIRVVSHNDIQNVIMPPVRLYFHAVQARHPSLLHAVQEQGCKGSDQDSAHAVKGVRQAVLDGQRAVKYCSKPCQKRRHKRIANSKKRSYSTRTGTAKCEICGKPFKTGQGHGHRRQVLLKIRALGLPLIDRACVAARRYCGN